MANIHLDATEYQDHIVFLHNIQEGPASRSYGLQVAKLAGVPTPVLKAAQEKLTALERTDKAKVSSLQPSPAQSDLFSAMEPHPAVELLQSLDVDNLSPRQALQKLYDLKAALE
jgi:DNA mismatch repair protein MutS